MIELCEQYREAHDNAKFLPRDVALWLLKNDLWEMPESNVVSKCSKDLTTALRLEIATTPNGEKVRAWLAAPIEMVDENGEPKQQFFWDHIETCSREHALSSFRSQRKALVDDAKSLKAQVDYFNDHNPNGKGDPIRVLFDLTEEVENESDE
jgi:hypothetical protein